MSDTIYSNCIGRGGDLHSGGNGTTDLAEDTAGSIGFPSTTNSSFQIGWLNYYGWAYQYYRSYMAFDTSGISVAPTSATLKLWPTTLTNGGIDFYITRAFLLTAGEVAGGDWDAWAQPADPGDGSGSPSASNITAYSAKWDVSASWPNDAYISITLNATALADMASRSEFQIGLISSPEVEQTTSPTDGVQYMTHGYSVNASGDHEDKKPYIEYTAAPAASPNLNIKSGILTLKPGASIIIKQ